MRKEISKVLLIFLCFGLSLSTFAQPPGDPGNGNPPGPDCTQPNPPASCNCPDGPFCEEIPVKGQEYLVVGALIIGIYFIRKRISDSLPEMND